MAFLIVILSIALISSLLLQHHLGTWGCTLSIRTKWLWLHSKCYLPNYSLLLPTTQHGIKPGCSWDSQPRTDTLLLNVAEQRDNYHDNQAFNYSWRLRRQSFDRQSDRQAGRQAGKQADRQTENTGPNKTSNFTSSDKNGKIQSDYFVCSASVIAVTERKWGFSFPELLPRDRNGLSAAPLQWETGLNSRQSYYCREPGPDLTPAV